MCGKISQINDFSSHAGFQLFCVQLQLFRVANRKLHRRKYIYITVFLTKSDL